MFKILSLNGIFVVYRPFVSYCYKLQNNFVQNFQPFVFGMERSTNSKQTYSRFLLQRCTCFLKECKLKGDRSGGV